MGVWRLCTGRYHDVAPMSFVYCVRPCRICGRRDDYRLEPWGAYTIRRSILYVLTREDGYLFRRNKPSHAQAENRKRTPSELRRDVARYRGAAHPLLGIHAPLPRQ